jgi:hypothetical protein
MEEFKLTLEFAHKLVGLRNQRFSAEKDYPLQVEDAYKKGLHKKPRFRVLGLRGLIRRDSGVTEVTIRYVLSDV